MVQIYNITITILREYKCKKTDKIGYVSGIVTSDGPDRIEDNVKNLIKYTKKIRNQYNFPIFSSIDRFSNTLINQLEEIKLQPKEIEKKFWELWRKILGSGYVTDIFMTPGWERSKGARDELKTAKKHRLNIHYI